MLHVNVYPDTTSRHVSHILTALSDLDHNKEIILKYRTDFDGRVNKAIPRGILYFEVTDDSMLDVTYKVCIDMMDSGRVVFEDRLNESDVYYKRSYDANYLDKKLNTEQRKKIKPYGLYFACKSTNYKSEYEFLIKFIWLYKTKYFSNFNEFKNACLLFKNPFKSSLYRLGLVKSFSFLINPESYETELDHSASGNVMYFTRIWNIQDMPVDAREAITKLNESRISLVRELKRSLGNNFTGGIMEDEHAKSVCPDIVVPIEICTRANYLQLMKKADICIATTGLYSSIGAKLPEYMAASKCVVSEPLQYQLPEPLVEHKNIMYFQSNEECVHICQQLINDPDKVKLMKAKNYVYYQKNVKPMSQLRNRLRELF